jgi:hypothetical protein
MSTVARLARGFAFGLACVLLVPLGCRRTLPMDGKMGSAGASGDVDGGATSGVAGAAAGGMGAGAAGGQAGSGSAGSGGQPSGGAINLYGSPIYTRVQRLTNAQWERAVADVLRLVSPTNLAARFATPAAGDATDFTNNEKRLFVDASTALDFEAGAEAAATLATGSAAELARLYPGTDAAGFVRTVGRRAFRRPLTSDEETKYQAVFALGEQLYGAGFANGAALVIRALLQSPKFLYRSELGPTGEPLSGYEVASKLSFWLLGTTPGDDLLDAAGAGALDSVAGLESAARAMLEQPAAVAIMRDFHGQLYALGRFDDFGGMGVSGPLAAELSETSYRFFDEVFKAGEGLRAILTSTRAFVGPELAPSYGLAPPAAIEQRTLDPSRTGYFTQVPFLLLNGLDEGTDAMRRGAALSGQVLCAKIPGHPAAPAPLPPLAPGQTNRERLEQLTANCTACHRDAIDPLGFAFEGFDGMGLPRALDNGEPVDTAGRYAFEEGVRQFADARELMKVLADGRQAHTCYAKMLTGYALQRDLVEGDRALLAELAEVSRQQSVKELIVSLVRKPAFRLRQEGTP